MLLSRDNGRAERAGRAKPAHLGSSRDPSALGSPARRVRSQAALIKVVMIVAVFGIQLSEGKAATDDNTDKVQSHFNHGRDERGQEIWRRQFCSLFEPGTRIFGDIVLFVLLVAGCCELLGAGGRNRK